MAHPADFLFVVIAIVLIVLALVLCYFRWQEIHNRREDNEPPKTQDLEYVLDTEKISEPEPIAFVF